MPRTPAHIRKAELALNDCLNQARESLSGSSVPDSAMKPLFGGRRKALRGLADKTTDAGAVVSGGRHDLYWQSVELNADEIGVEEIEDKGWLRDPEKARERFGLRSIEFGNWLNEYERQTYLYGTMQGLDDLARILGIPRRLVGMGGRLSVALGVRGKGNANAHYERYKFVTINIAYSTMTEVERTGFPEMGIKGSDPMKKGRRRGKASLAHEYGHALDNLLAILSRSSSDDMLSGGHSISHQFNDQAKGLEYTFEELFSLLYWRDDGERTSFGDYLHRLKDKDQYGEYVNRRAEVWARTFETWVAYRMAEMKIVNGWLAKPLSYLTRVKIYPSRAALRTIEEHMQELIEEAFDLCKKKAVIDDWKKQEEKKKESSRNTTKTSPPKTSKVKKKSSPAAGRKKGELSYGKETTVETRTDSIPAKYAIVELRSIIPSHDPRTWSPHPLYPLSCQQRDYTHDKSEQAKVERGARALDPKYLLTDTPTAVDGPPVVAGNLVSLGGNGRTMMGLLADDESYARYVRELQDRLSLFSITANLDEYDRPFLVRIIEADMESCAKYSNILNKGLTQDVDITTETVSFARQLAPADLEELGEYFDEREVETLAEALRDRSIQNRVVRVFRRASIITSQNQSQWLDPASGELSDLGRLLVEKILLGAILRDKRLIDAAQSYTAKIVRALPLIVRMQRLSAEWDLSPNIEEAIRLESARRASRQKKGDMLAQSDAFSSRISERTELVWDLLDQSPLKFKSFLEMYVSQGEKEAELQKGEDFGFTEPMTPDAVLQRVKGGLGDEIEPAEEDGSGLVTLREVTGMRYEPLPLSQRWGDFFGEIPENFKVDFWGPEGSGKSTAALEFADEVSRLRNRKTGDRWNVLYAAVEESTKSAGFQKRAAISQADSPRVFIFDDPTLGQIEEQLRSGKFQAVVIDSVSVLTDDTRDMVKAAKRFPDLMWIFVVHALKTGDRPKGASDLYHFVDASVAVHDGVASTTPRKNRYGKPATLKIFAR